MTVPVIGTRRLIEPGVIVYHADKVDSDEFPVGGICIEHSDQVDTETGEVTRSWLVVGRVDLRQGRIHSRWIAEHDIDAETCEVATSGQLYGLARKIAAAVSHKDKYQLRGGPFTVTDRDALRWAYILAVLVLP